MSNLVLGKPWIVNLVSGSPEHECVYIVYNVTATVDGPLNPGVTSSKDVNSVLIYSPSFLLNPVWLFLLSEEDIVKIVLQRKSMESNKSRTHWLSLYGRKKHWDKISPFLFHRGKKCISLIHGEEMMTELSVLCELSLNASCNMILFHNVVDQIAARAHNKWLFSLFSDLIRNWNEDIVMFSIKAELLWITCFSLLLLESDNCFLSNAALNFPMHHLFLQNISLCRPWWLM